MGFDRGEIRMKATNISIMDRKGGKSIMGCRVMSGAITTLTLVITSMLQKFTFRTSLELFFFPPIGRQTLIGGVHQGGDLGYPTSAICEGNIPTFLVPLKSHFQRFGQSRFVNCTIQRCFYILIIRVTLGCQ